MHAECILTSCTSPIWGALETRLVVDDIPGDLLRIMHQPACCMAFVPMNPLLAKSGPVGNSLSTVASFLRQGDCEQNSREKWYGAFHLPHQPGVDSSFIHHHTLLHSGSSHTCNRAGLLDTWTLPCAQAPKAQNTVSEVKVQKIQVQKQTMRLYREALSHLLASVFTLSEHG